MEKEIIEIQTKLKKLIDGNWANDQIGQLEEIENKVNKIGDLLTFIAALLIHNEILSLDLIKGEYPEGWKIDYE